ncbi:MAG: hemolysin family protein [Proteobacteria bacterium]|nr:hemolysin family protein [Pseudomonadota bacterium]
MVALIAAFLCVLANAFFVAAEFAMARVRPTAMQARAQAGDKLAERALRMISRLDAYLTATQFGITLASLALGWLGEPAVAGLIRPLLQSLGMSPVFIKGTALAIAFGVITSLHIVVGELVPKSLAILRPEAVTRWTTLPMLAFYWFMYPVLYVLNGISNFLLRAMGLPSGEAARAKLSAEELQLIVRASFDDKGVEGTKRDLLERVLRSTDRPLRAIMIPRVDIVTLSLADTDAQCLAKIRKYGFSRYPLSEDADPDRVVGYIYVKDLLLATGRAKGGIRAMKRDVLFVPETQSVGDLLALFQRTAIPLAIAVDEYGGTSGLVTVEDVVEELVGDLHDELDGEQPRVEAREDGTIVVDGTLPVGELPIDGFHVEPGLAHETLGGFIIATLGRLAHPGDRVRMGQFEAVVEDVRRRRIGRVAVRRYVPTLRPEKGDSVPPPSPVGLDPDSRADLE